jgi:hypothetical protein
MSARFRTVLHDRAEAIILLIAFGIAALLWPTRDLVEGE